MNIALGKALTVSDFLAWAESQTEVPRAELINGQIVPMSPERVAHNRIKSAVFIALRRAMAAADVVGEVFIDGLTVPIDPHTAYEPDVLVRCGAPLLASEMKVTDPSIVVEVISPSSAHSDTSAKLIGYFKLPSVCHYLVIDPDTRAMTHHTRAAEGNIENRMLTQGTLKLDPPGITVEVKDLFA